MFKDWSSHLQKPDERDIYSSACQEDAQIVTFAYVLIYSICLLSPLRLSGEKLMLNTIASLSFLVWESIQESEGHIPEDAGSVCILSPST